MKRKQKEADANHAALLDKIASLEKQLKHQELRAEVWSGKIMVDKAVLTEYLDFVGKTELPKSRYEIVDLDETIPKRACK